MTRLQVGLRVVLLLTPVLALSAAPGRTPLLELLLAAVLGVLAWRTPDSMIGFAVLGLVGWRWTAVADGELPLSALVSVTAVVAFEAASILASYGPPELRLSPALLQLWTGRALVMLLPAFVVFAAGRLLVAMDGSATLWFVGAVAAVLCLVVMRQALGLRHEVADLS